MAHIPRRTKAPSPRQQVQIIVGPPLSLLRCLVLSPTLLFTGLSSCLLQASGHRCSSPSGRDLIAMFSVCVNSCKFASVSYFCLLAQSKATKAKPRGASTNPCASLVALPGAIASFVSRFWLPTVLAAVALAVIGGAVYFSQPPAFCDTGGKTVCLSGEESAQQGLTFPICSDCHLHVRRSRSMHSLSSSWFVCHL
jgi:hypothetical protein